MTVSQRPGAETSKWIAAINNIINHTCAFSYMTRLNVQIQVKFKNYIQIAQIQ